MMFDVIRIPAFKDNYIWLLRKGAAAAVVDPGDAQPVLEVLEREHLSLTAILVTHHHADHQGGVSRLLAHYRAEVFGPAVESITGISVIIDQIAVIQDTIASAVEEQAAATSEIGRSATALKRPF